MAGLERWKARHAAVWPKLEPADVLVDSMRGRSSSWYRIRLNLQHVPEAERPPQEPLEVDYDPWHSPMRIYSVWAFVVRPADLLQMHKELGGCTLGSDVGKEGVGLTMSGITQVRLPDGQVIWARIGGEAGPHDIGFGQRAKVFVGKNFPS